MPNTREKLAHLIVSDLPEKDQIANAEAAGKLADHLIANGVTIQRFIPVSEGLPKKMGKYLCRYVFGENADYPFEQVLWYYSNLEKPHFQHEGSMGLRVTHWMPLPQTPKEGE